MSSPMWNHAPTLEEMLAAAPIVDSLNERTATLEAELAVPRGDEFGAWSLSERIRKLADATADVRREASRLLHVEE